MTESEPILPYWHSMTTADAAALAGEDPVAVLPLGAVEQHGPHLPLSTDLDIVVGLLERAFEELDDHVPARVLPPVAVGASEEHGGFVGTLSLSHDQVAEIIRSQGRDLARSGVRRLVLVSGHGGNGPAMESAGLDLRREEGLLVVRTTYFDLPRPPTADLPPEEWRHGIHGGALETALMLHFHPDRVRVDALKRFRSLGESLGPSLELVGPVGPAPFSWMARDLNPEGAVGDATLATAEMGRRIARHYGSLLARIIEEARAFPLERLARAGDRTADSRDGPAEKAPGKSEGGS